MPNKQGSVGFTRTWQPRPCSQKLIGENVTEKLSLLQEAPFSLPINSIHSKYYESLKYKYQK